MLSLKDLDIVYHSQIEIEGYIIPLKFDIAKITEEHYIYAYSMMNEYKEEKVEPEKKEKSELEDLQTIYFTDDGFELSYEPLYYKYELDEIEELDKMSFLYTFINTDDKLFNGKTLLQELEIENIQQLFELIEATDTFYNSILKVVSFWVNHAIFELHQKVKYLLILNDKDGTDMNFALSKLKSCYKTMQMYYFKENINVKCFEDLSYREQHLLQSFETKMNYLDIAINKEARKKADSINNENNNTKPKKKHWSSSKRH